jgi:uncharacterized protein (TIGR03437 family)
MLLGLLAATAQAQSVPVFSAEEVQIPVGVGSTVPGTGSVTVNASAGVQWEIRNATGVPWLSISPTTGTGTQTVNFTVDGRLINQTGQYSAQVTVTLPGTSSGDFVWVRANAGTGGGSSTLNASPASVLLQGISGQAQVNPVSVTITNTSGATGTPFTVSSFTTSGGGWLSVTSSATTTPAFLTVSANQAGLGTATYSGNIIVTPASGQPLQIPVTLQANGTGQTGFTLSANQLFFQWQTGTAAPSQQSVFVGSATGSVLTYIATATSNGSWLRVQSSTGGVASTSTTGQTGTSILVSVDPTSLTTGIYDGTIQVTSSGYAAQTINVRLTVNTSSTLVANPTPLTFTYVPGSALPGPQYLSISSPTGALVSYTVATSSAGWLTASPNVGSTASGQNQVTVSVNPTGLGQSTYNGSVLITPVGSTDTLTVPVTLNVGTTGSLVFSVNPSSLSFQSQMGGGVQTQALSIASFSGLQEGFLASAESTGGWLNVSPTFGTTPFTLSITANPSALTTAGSYSGNIRLQSLSTLNVQFVPVTLTISGGVAVNPTSLTFTGNVGGTAPVGQAINLTGATVNFTASSNVSWLQITPTSGFTPQSITVRPVLTGLGAGTHQATVTITAGGQTFSIPVTLTLTQAVEVNVSSTSLTFAHQTRPGQAAPAAQTVSVTSPQGNVQFTANASTTSGGSWLSVTPNSGTTPRDISISVDPASLAVGSYSGSVTVAGPGGASSRVISVTLNVTAPPAATVSAITNGASLAPTAISPGLIITAWGSGFGGGTGLFGQVTGGRLITQLGNTRLLFDNVAAPLLYVGENQINAVVPYAVYGRVSTRVQVEVNGVRSEGVDLRVVDSAPAIFSADQSGRGPGAILNQNGTLNSAANPAARGSVITFWATGEGLVNPPAQDGQIISANDLREPVLPVSIIFGTGQNAVPGIREYAGSAPGFVSGSMQVNGRIPANAPTGNNVPVVLNVGSASSSTAITVAIQ